jgi:hypothetical protein
MSERRDLPDETALAVLLVLAWAEERNDIHRLLSGELSMFLRPYCPNFARAIDELRAQLGQYIASNKPVPPWLSQSIRQSLIVTKPISDQPNRTEEKDNVHRE